MNASAEFVSATPFILYLFCALSAMAIVVGILRWIWVMREDKPSNPGLGAVILSGQLYVFLSVTLFSLLATLVVFVFPFEDTTYVTIIPEILILCGAGYFFSKRFKRQSVGYVKGFTKELGSIVFWVVSCILGWAISFGVGILLYYLVSFMARNNSDFVLVAVMMTGLLWNFPTLTLFYRVRRRYSKTTGLLRYSMQTVLMPMALAYGILMVPLGIQEAANSKEFQKQKYEKPIRKA